MKTKQFLNISLIMTLLTGATIQNTLAAPVESRNNASVARTYLAPSQMLYAAGRLTDELDCLSIDPVTGALTSQPACWNWKKPTGFVKPADIEINNYYLYIPSLGMQATSIFHIDPHTGWLDFKGDGHDGLDAFALYMINLPYAYTTNTMFSSITVDTIDPVTGAMTEIPESKLQLQYVAGPSAMLKNPLNPQFYYVSDFLSDHVELLSVDDKGVLHETGRVFQTEVTPRNMVVYNKHYVYITNYRSNSISQFEIHANGDLTPLNPPTVSTGDAINPARLMINGNSAYAEGQMSGIVAQYTINPNGTLTPKTPAFISIDPGAQPYTAVLDTLNQRIYFGDTLKGHIPVIDINPDGSLNQKSLRFYDTVMPDPMFITSLTLKP